MSANHSERLRRHKEFEDNQHRRQAIQIETMIAELDRMCIDLGRQIEAEETRARIHDPAHFAYPMYAKAARERCANIQNSTNALRAALDKLRLEENASANRQHAA